MSLGSLHAADWVIASATLIGPILAVQAQKAVERVTARRNEKRWVFSTLMMTRATKVHIDHVRALNSIDVSFYGHRVLGRVRWQSKSEKAVIDVWRQYIANLLDAVPPARRETHSAARTELFVTLLSKMADDLGYEFDRVMLTKSGYYPQAHADIEQGQRQIRDAALAVLEGRAPIHIAPAQNVP